MEIKIKNRKKTRLNIFKKNNNIFLFQTRKFQAKLINIGLKNGYCDFKKYIKKSINQLNKNIKKNKKRKLLYFYNN